MILFIIGLISQNTGLDDRGLRFGVG